MRNTVAAAIGLLLAGLGADAYAQNVIRITNANNHEIPLRTGSTVSFDSSGNLNAECELTEGVCTQLSNGGPVGNVPTVTLTRTGTGAINAGQTVTLGWTSTNAQVCNASATGPSSTTWPGPKAITGSNVNITLGTQGEHSLSLKCFNDDGGSAVQSVPVTVNQSQVVTACTPELLADDAVQPDGFTMVPETWEQAWSSPDGSIQPTYPNGSGINIPIEVNARTYKAISFTPTANLTVSMTFDAAQANRLIGYNSSRTADAMLVTISPCAGDFRPVNAAAADPFQRPKCRFYNSFGTIIYSTNSSLTSTCQLVAGTQYFMNFIPANPDGGITAGESSCSSAFVSSGCDIMGKHRVQ